MEGVFVRLFSTSGDLAAWAPDRKTSSVREPRKEHHHLGRTRNISSIDGLADDRGPSKPSSNCSRSFVHPSRSVGGERPESGVFRPTPDEGAARAPTRSSRSGSANLLSGSRTNARTTNPSSVELPKTSHRQGPRIRLRGATASGPGSHARPGATKSIQASGVDYDRVC